MKCLWWAGVPVLALSSIDMDWLALRLARGRCCEALWERNTPSVLRTSHYARCDPLGDAIPGAMKKGVRAISWRTRPLVGEALRGLSVSSWRTLLSVIAAMSLLGTLGLSELDTTRRILDLQRDIVRRGGNVAVAFNEGRLPAGRCEALNRQGYVLSAGGLAGGRPVETLTAPETPIQSAAATSGAFAVWDPNRAPTGAELSSGAVVGVALSEELGLRRGLDLLLEDGRKTRVAAVIDPTARTSLISRWILEPLAPAGTVDACWVEFSSGNLEPGLLLLEALFADSGEELAVRPLIRRDEFTRNPQIELINRPQARAWIPAGLLLGILFWLATWFRRAEIGLYRAVGTSGANLYFVGQVEAFVILLVAGVSSILWSMALHVLSAGWPSLDQLLIVLRTMGSAALLAVLLAPMPWALIGRRALAGLLKDR